MRRNEPQVNVQVTNIKKIVPACRRCRIRTNGEMLMNLYQPMICKKCQGVMEEEYRHFILAEPANLEKARECLWNHERECGCWCEGLKFLDPL